MDQDTAFFPQFQMDYSIIFDDHYLNFIPFSPQDESESAFSSIHPTMIDSYNIDKSVSDPKTDYPYNAELMEEDIKRPVKQQKIISNNSSNEQIISSGKSNLSLAISQQNYGDDDLDYPITYNVGAKNSSIRGPLEAKEHVIAERKRREKINQLYIALSALLPNLKRADKASIVDGANKYVKQLQERLEILEEKAAKKKVESTIFVKKTLIISADEELSTLDYNHSSLPEIEARMSGRDVLIRAHCEKNKRFLLNFVLDEVQKLNLKVVSSNVMPFGRGNLYITITAQMEDSFSSNITDLVKSLRLALQPSA